METEAGVTLGTLGTSSVSSREPRQRETGRDLSDLRTLVLTREESIASPVHSVPHEDVGPDQSEWEDPGTLRPTGLVPASTASSWLGKTKFLISDANLGPFQRKLDSGTVGN